jgi:hypothetical protein
MIIKKLAVPLVNDKILLQAEHCYIATTAISEQGFEFMRARLPLKSKIEIVTGLDGPTSPAVLRRIWRHYHDRMSLKVYTRNFFHANVYIFDLPYRKAVAFAGSGHLTLEGIKDGEEIFYKITDPKEIEALKSWFTGYYEFSEPLTESILQEYEGIYPSIRQREIASREEKEQAMALTTRGFSWDTIRFKNQYFKKEDYLAFANSKTLLNTPEIDTERAAIQDKLLHLHELLKSHFEGLGLQGGTDRVSSLAPADHPDGKIRSLWISFGRRTTELPRYTAGAKPADLMSIQIIIGPRDTGIRLLAGKPNGGREDREYFRKQMEEAAYRSTFFKLVQDLGDGYRIEIAGEKKPVNVFQTEDALWEFTQSDDWRYYTFAVGRNYTPGDPAISNENIPLTMTKESDKLVMLYRHMSQ